jgi:hypothetical protein
MQAVKVKVTQFWINPDPDPFTSKPTIQARLVKLADGGCSSCEAIVWTTAMFAYLQET